MASSPTLSAEILSQAAKAFELSDLEAKVAAGRVSAGTLTSAARAVCVGWYLAGFLIGLTLAPAANAARFANGSFETPGGASVRDALTTNYLPSWTYTAVPDGLDIYEPDNQDNLLAADGSR